MTTVQPPGQGLVDPDVLDAWFAELAEPVSGRLHISRLGLGQSNLTFMVNDDDGRRGVLLTIAGDATSRLPHRKGSAVTARSKLPDARDCLPPGDR